MQEKSLQTNNMPSKKEKKRIKAPHVFVILFVLILCAMIATYIIPAGHFERVDLNGRMIIDPTSFTYVESPPVSLLEALNSITTGMSDVVEIIAFLLIMGGAFNVIQSTDAIKLGIGKVVLATQKSSKDKLVIPALMLLFGIGGHIFGMAEETLPFISVMVILAISMGFDSITGAAIALVGACTGVSCSIMSPFTTGVAQTIAELPYMSGSGFRIGAYILMFAIASTYVMKYAYKVKKDPKASLVYEIDKNRNDTLDLNDMGKLTGRHKVTLIIFFAMIGLIVYGVMKLSWGITQMTSTFLGASIIIAFIHNIGFNEYAQIFSEGLESLAVGATVVALSRAVLVILTAGNVIDTILYSASNALSHFPASISCLGIYIFQCLLNFLIPSGSGQAAVSIPILAPLADLIGVTRQTTVIAFQLGDAISNILIPVCGYFMAALSIAKIPYERWVKWILSLIGLQYLGGAVVVLVAHFVQVGPF